MAINELAPHEDDSGEESEEESSDDESDDESYDYGFADGDDEEEEDSDYEVDYAGMNVSPEILRMLGASEEEIAAKEAEVAGVTSTWVPPTETGLEHSAAIADSAAVAIGAGGAPAGAEVKRVFKAVGTFDNEGAKDAAAAAAAAAPPGDAPVLKVKISHAPEPVPKKRESKLPPRSEQEDGGSDGDDDSDGSWDEASIIDGHAWWESGSEDEELATSAMSPNLRSALGLAKPAATTGGGEAGGNDWQPPSFAGLTNSKPLMTLQPLVVGNKNKGLQVEYRGGNSGEDDGQGGEDSDEWSEEEGWDYEDVPDDEYVLDWSTTISPNLAKAMGQSSAVKNKVEVISAQLSWKPPSTPGLKNSAPIIDTSRRSFVENKICWNA